MMTHADTASDFVFRTTANGVLVADKARYLRRLNPASCSMLGVALVDVMNKPIGVTFARNQALLNLFAADGEQQLDVHLPRRRLAKGIATTLQGGERIVLLQDITEQHDLDTRRETLTRAIAHDLRNPISAIGGFVDLVGKSGDLSDLQRKFLTRARQTVNKLNDMIASLVDLAWIESGMPFEHIPIRLDETIQHVVYNLQPLAEKHRIGIVLSLQTALPIVMGDPTRLELAIYHLIQNALLYTLMGEKNIVVHAWSDNEEIYCNIADQGIGISTTELAFVFDRMYRAKDERVSEIPGGGLGLTIARTIIKRHGGNIWANSNQQGGITMTFVLPIVAS